MIDEILIVDDDPDVLRSLDRALRNEGFGVPVLCGDSRQVAPLVASRTFSTVLLDLGMPHLHGEAVLDLLRVSVPETPVIVVTAIDRVDTAVRCIRAGAFDYLVKPIDLERLLTSLLRAREYRGLRLENRELSRRVASARVVHPEWFADIVTNSPSMHAIFNYVEAVAPGAEPVLLVGETGCGKELVASAVHRASGCVGEMVSVNVAGIDDTAFTDTLFGHKRGAFTGAAGSRAGLVERAVNGTLFLDEIGDLRPDSQVKLLRLLQEHEYFPLGADRPHTSNCRIVASTNRDLRRSMRKGEFREDLYYRLHAHVVRVPPLRERPGDVPLLVHHFLRAAADSFGKAKPTPPPELFTYLNGYTFPGNVRELRAMVLDAVAQHERGVLSMRVFLEHIDLAGELELWRGAPAGDGDAEQVAFGSTLPTLRDATCLLLREALRRCDGNQSAAAKILGVSRRTINRYVKSGHLDTEDGETDE